MDAMNHKEVHRNHLCKGGLSKALRWGQVVSWRSLLTGTVPGEVWLADVPADTSTCWLLQWGMNAMPGEVTWGSHSTWEIFEDWVQVILSKDSSITWMLPLRTGHEFDVGYLLCFSVLGGTRAFWTRQNARQYVGNMGAWNSSQAVSWGNTVSPWETTAGSHLDKPSLILRIFSESVWLSKL